MTSIPLRGALAALALALARATVAQGEEPPPVHLPEVVVPLSRLEAAQDATASATVVEAGRFEGEAKGVAELVATAPGVAVRDYGGLGKLATVSIRGSSADAVTVMLDGLVLNTAFGGGVDLSTIPRSWIDRIEVVRGAEGAHYGAGALGGVVNVITRPAAAGAWSASTTGGSFLTGSAAGDAAAGGDRWAVMGAAAVEGSGGGFPYLFSGTPTFPANAQVSERENNASLLAGGLLKAWSRLGDGRLDLLAQASGGHRQVPPPPYAIPPGGSSDWQRDGRVALLSRYAVSLAPGLSLSAGVSGRFDRLDVSLASLAGEVRQRDAQGRASSEVRWLHGAGTLAAGGSIGAERLAADGIGDPRVRWELAAWASEELSLDAGRLRIAPAVRLDRVGPYPGVSGKLGSTLRLGGPLSVRASAGRSFRPPSFGELYLQQGLLEPNPSLRPEEAWSADAAVQAQGALGLASAGAFVTLYRDLIVYEPGSFQRLKPFNDGKALVRGLELEVASAPLRSLLGLAVEVSYTLLASETLRGAEDELGRDLPHRPRHRLYGRLAIGDAPAGAHLECTYVGLQYQDARNLQPIPAALSFNAGGFVRIASRPEVRLSLELKNLLDDLSLKNGFGYPLPGRTVLVSVRAESTPGG
ncbi:MAG TPA: TonB-dependent receptor [Anaeromyxobacteraceae bacterium]|nr:TonB-dependent receptor [Anaeromyxobacteraceae bacterium]